MLAQQKLSLDDVTPGGKGYEIKTPKNLPQLQWWSDKLVFEENNAIVRLRPATQKKELLCTLDQLNAALIKAELPPRKKFPSFFMPAKKATVFFQAKDTVLMYNTRTEAIQKIFFMKGSQHIDYCAQNGCFAYTFDNNLWLNNGENNLPITAGTDKAIVHGQAVHRNEFGIRKGTFWSPKGNYLAFYTMDESMVSKHTLLDNSCNPPKPKVIAYPAAGEASHWVKIGIYSVKTGKIAYLNTGAPFDRYFTNLSWTPDEKELLVAELNRTQKLCELKAYSIRQGTVRILFSESSNTFVEPEHPPFFIDSMHYLWLSKRSGYQHIYCYHLTNNSYKTLTKGDWNVVDMLGIHEASGTVLFSSTEASPLEKNLYALSVADGKQVQISTEGGQHQGLVSASGQFLVDQYSALTIPRRIDLYRIPENNSVRLLSAENPYLSVAMPEIQLGKITSVDKQTDLYYRLTLPVNFSPKKKYPVVVYVYGGPHVQLVQNTWLGGSKGWELYMAQQGFVCFSLDGRGAEGKGKVYEDLLYNNIGKIQLEDQLEGIAFLQSLPFVDSTRMGVYGWSFGGFMALQLMLKTPGIFKAAVAGGAVTDWRLYEAMYGERYMQTPAENQQGYAENDVSNFVSNLTGKLLLIHCELDPVVRIAHAEKFLQAANAAHKKVPFIRYQKHEHNVHGKDRVGLFKTISAFFEQHLCVF